MIDRTELLRELIRMDTTNPPGNEVAVAALISQTLRDHGISTETFAKDPHRPNLIARLPGRGDAPPFLMQGHMDVVATTDQRWARDPFAGDLIDGYVWGRGALDMKGPLVMMIDALIRIAEPGRPPAGDVILAAVADEERLGTFGAKFLVEDHPEVFDGVLHCIGEFGGFPFRLDGTKFYPIQVAERIGVYFELTFEGPAGHGSLPVRGGAMAKLGKALTALDHSQLPVTVTPASRLMLEALAANTSGATRLAIRTLMSERTAAATLRTLGSRLAALAPTLRSTVSPTKVRGGTSENVIPTQVKLGLDGRLLPGTTVEQMEHDLHRIVGPEVYIEAHTDGATSQPDPDMTLFPVLADAIRQQDPDAVPVPFLMPAVTDGRWFAELGIQPYGFCPMNLPVEFDFQNTVHGADERIPVDALGFGSDAIVYVLQNLTAA